MPSVRFLRENLERHLSTELGQRLILVDYLHVFNHCNNLKIFWKEYSTLDEAFIYKNMVLFGCLFSHNIVVGSGFGDTGFLFQCVFFSFLDQVSL